jgi:hypothetical protein
VLGHADVQGDVQEEVSTRSNEMIAEMIIDSALVKPSHQGAGTAKIGSRGFA